MAEWLPIATAPKDGTEIILYVPCEHKLRSMYVGCYVVRETFMYGKSIRKYEGWNFGFNDLVTKELIPTHWMSFPENKPEVRNG